MSPSQATKCFKCRRYCRLVATFLFSHVGLCALVVGYSIVGALTFEALEAGQELARRQALLRERDRVIAGLWSLTADSSVLSEHNWTALATETLQDFEVTLVRAVRKEGYDGKDDNSQQWTFSGALLYSIIVITTIGYGNIAPKTAWGKVVTILYAIVGIPLLLLCLSNIGDAMAHSFKFVYWKVCCYLCVRPKKIRKKHSSRPVAVPYRQTTLGQTSIRHPMASPTESPQMASSSTYHTAHSDTSPTISSPSSTPQHPSPKRFQEKSGIRLHQNKNNFPLNGPLAPVITNKYVLQDDKRQIKNFRMDDPILPTLPISTIMGSGRCGAYQYNSQTAYRTNGRFYWEKDPPLPDENTDSTDDDSSPDLEEEEEVSVPMWLCLALVISYICGGGVLFTFWEKWNFLDSSYFCFVTLTTIGFGDLVPGTAVISDDNQLTLGLCSLYLLFGMALLAMSFNLVQEEVTRSVKCVGRRIGIISDDEDD